MIKVLELETGREYGFVARTPYEAMKKMIYTLSLSAKEDVTIHKTEDNKVLWFSHRDSTYATLMKPKIHRMPIKVRRKAIVQRSAICI